jgi:PmbA protein
MIPDNFRKSGSALTVPVEALYRAAEQALAEARRLGATDAECDVSTSVGLAVNVRKGELETVEHTRDKSLSITVYLGHQRGSASSTDYAPDALARTVAAACTIARHTAADPAAGLADPDRLATGPGEDLQLHHPVPLCVEAAAEAARRCEAAGMAVDTRIRNSEGASVNTSEADFVYANTHGFACGYASSRASISCTLIAEDSGGMQRDYWFSSERDAARLARPEEVGRIAGERAVRRLGATRIGTAQVPVVFEANIASSLIGHLVGAISGGSLYRKASFLLDAAGSEVFAACVDIEEDPFIIQGNASASFDSEGVATRRRMLVENGVLTGYLLGSYSARKLGLASTGNAGGNHNLRIRPTVTGGLPALLAQMGRGVLVTELMGQGVNTVTGDYSRGAVGFWVEGGVIRHAIEEVTIAGNLRQMFRDIVAIGDDVLVRGSKHCGSILLERMTVAGA